MKTLLCRSLLPLFGLVLSALVGLGFADSAREESPTPTTVIVLRHAEADASDPADRNPGLSEAGTQRAEALARLLSHAGVTQLYCSEYRRTHDTLLPLATALQLEPVQVSARTPDEQVRLLRALPPGSVAVVAGHSNTAPGLVEALGATPQEVERQGQQGPVLGHDEYDRLFVLTLPPSTEVAPALLELRYGN